MRSTNDARTSNNTMRHQYRVLSETEKLQIQKLKDTGLDFLSQLHQVGGTWASWMDNPETKLSSRELSLAQTKMEEAVMWAVKSITK